MSQTDLNLKSNCTNKLDRRKHIEKLIDGLTCPLPRIFEKLVPAQTWTVYWITHSLNLLDQSQFLNTISDDVIEFVRECAHKDGGYGGGPGQIGHLATTFAAVSALVTVANETALDSINRINLVQFLHRLKQPDGSFAMHDDGEVDSRASYCALAVLKCLNIQDSILLENVAEWILSCQTYEGGFGSVPGSEAHGGYTFCCVASLCLLNQLQRADVPALLRWLTNKQMSEDKGFCGRSNKLVDSCYSYWQGAIFPLIHVYLDQQSSEKNEDSTKLNQGKKTSQEEKIPKYPNTRSTTRTKAGEKEVPMTKLLNNWLFDCESLQDYVLNQCQPKGGLLRDKPGVPPDFYHTCYALSGLSLSQHQPDGSLLDIGHQHINTLAMTHPLFNVTPVSLDYCLYYFRNKKIEIFEEDQPSS